MMQKLIKVMQNLKSTWQRQNVMCRSRFITNGKQNAIAVDVKGAA